MHRSLTFVLQLTYQQRDINFKDKDIISIFLVFSALFISYLNFSLLKVTNSSRKVSDAKMTDEYIE